jgi:catechol 1,2-dioxygenase
MTMTVDIRLTSKEPAMTTKLLDSPEIQNLLNRVSGLDQQGGNPRTKQILRRMVADLYAVIEEFAVTPEEFWQALAFLQGAAPEFGLIAPGLGLEHFLDLRMDLADQDRGRAGGTPRTIEGPLYVPGAPVSKGWARLDDGTDEGETLVMHGTVRDANRRPIPGAIVDVWQCNTRGAYSHFDPSQSRYNNRRRIETDDAGRYKFRSVVPAGYGVPPGGATERLLAAVGRHGRRPAHVHFFISAPGFRHLTTQINIGGDPYLHDDFAYATRSELIPATVRRDDALAIQNEELAAPFTEIDFDFVLLAAIDPSESSLALRPRAEPLG